MLDDISQQTQYGLVAALLVAVAIGFGAGTVVSDGSGPSGAITADSGDASTDEIRQTVQSLMDQQIQSQQQQFQAMAAQDPNISADDLSIQASVEDVSQSQFAGLYKVTVSMQGQAPGQFGNVQDIDEQQELYISADGRYVFQSPTDLEQPQQPTQQAPQQPPTGGQ